MKEYMLSIVFAVVVCTGAGLLVPAPCYNGIIKIVCGIFVVHTLIAPISAVLSRKPELVFNFDTMSEEEFESLRRTTEDKYRKSFNQKLDRIRENHLERELEQVCCEGVGIRFEDDALCVYNVPLAYRDNISKYLKEKYHLIPVFR